MLLMQHLWESVVFLLILLGPLPLCLSVIVTLESGKARSSPTHCWLVLLTCWSIIETCIGLFLGFVKQFTPSGVLISELILFLAGLIFFKYVKRQTSSSFSKWLVLTQPLSRHETLIVGAVACVGLALLWRLAAEPITDYDSLMYHLPTMANWYQTASFTMMEQFDPTRGNPAKWKEFVDMNSRFPYNWEVLCALFLIPFKEDFLVAFPNLIAWVLLGLSVYLLCSKIGVSRIPAMASSAFVLTLPLVIYNVHSMHVDLPLGSFFMVSLYLALCYNLTRTLHYFALFLATLGMLAGIKITGLVYGSLLIGVLALMEGKFILLERPINPASRPKKFVTVFVITGIFCLLSLGGFWYLRNLIETGNPLAYVRVQLGNFIIFPGPMGFTELRTTSLLYLFDPGNLSHWETLLRQVKSWLDVPFLAMALHVLLLPIAIRTGHRQMRNEHLVGLLALVIITGLLHWITPFSGNDGSNRPLSPWIGQQFRFAFPFLGALAVGAGAGATVLRTRDEAMVAVVLISSVLAMTETLTLYIGVALLLGWGMYEAIGWIRPNKSVPIFLELSGRVIAIFILVGFIAAATFLARQKREVRRGQVYGGIVEYIENHIGLNETIGYLLSHRSYLFYGKKLNRRVLYVPSQHWYLSEWLGVLQRQGVSVVAVGPLVEEGWKSRRELPWLQDPDGPFIRVFGQDPGRETVLYRLKSSQTRAAHEG